MQLVSHPFIKKYEDQQVDLAGFVHSVFDPTERLKDLSDVSHPCIILFQFLMKIIKHKTHKAYLHSFSTLCHL